MEPSTDRRRGWSTVAAAVLLCTSLAVCGGPEKAAPGSAPAAGAEPAGPAAPAPSSPTSPEPVEGRDRSPVQQPGGEWSTADPAEHGLDPERVAAGVREIAAQPGVRTLLVVAGGELVVEEAWGGASTRRPANLMSASKSLLSALVGIALDDGTLSGLDATVAELLPRALPEDAGGKRTISLRHLLTQTSGLASTSGEHYGAWVSTGDWSRAALARPLLEPPGEQFRYSTGNTHLTAAMLAAAAGEDLLAYARRELFDPLGIGAVEWDESPEGVRFGGNGLAMTPRDAARFGLLYLERGRWGGAQVVPDDWVAASTRTQAETPTEWAQRYGDYGYLWWVPQEPGGHFTAVGYGGQFVHVAPQAGVVVVITSTIESKGAEWDRRVLGIVRDRFTGG